MKALLIKYFLYLYISYAQNFMSVIYQYYIYSIYHCIYIHIYISLYIYNEHYMSISFTYISIKQKDILLLFQESNRFRFLLSSVLTFANWQTNSFLMGVGGLDLLFFLLHFVSFFLSLGFDDFPEASVTLSLVQNTGKTVVHKEVDTKPSSPIIIKLLLVSLLMFAFLFCYLKNNLKKCHFRKKLNRNVMTLSIK